MARKQGVTVAAPAVGEATKAKLLAAAHEAIRGGHSAAAEAFAALAGEQWSTSEPARAQGAKEGKK